MADKIYGSNNEPLKIQFITDTHYYSRKNGTQGKAYEKDESKSQMVVKDSDLVLKRAFDMLCEDTSTDIVVLSGDINTLASFFQIPKHFNKFLVRCQLTVACCVT